jgi:hypothetical protein
MKLLTKKVFKLKKTKRTICVVASSRKLGVTHISLAIANFLASVQKQKVLYVEVSSKSQLISTVGQSTDIVHGKNVFKYKGVCYLLAASIKEALEVMSLEDYVIIYDLESYNPKTEAIVNRCQVRLAIGSMKPWCEKEYHELIYQMKGDIKEVRFFNKGNSQDEKRKFKSIYKTHLESLPPIDNPFSLKETEFERIYELIE